MNFGIIFVIEIQTVRSAGTGNKLKCHMPPIHSYKQSPREFMITKRSISDDDDEHYHVTGDWCSPSHLIPPKSIKPWYLIAAKWYCPMTNSRRNKGASLISLSIFGRRFGFTPNQQHNSHTHTHMHLFNRHLSVSHSSTSHHTHFLLHRLFVIYIFNI